MTRARVLVIIGLVVVEGLPARASTPSAGATTPSLPRVRSDDCRSSGFGGDPMDVLRRSDVALTAALRRHLPDWSPDASIQAARVDRLLGEILDYEGIASQALGARWATLSADQRAAFLRLFTPLTYHALVSASERHVSMSYESESINGPEATVVVTPHPSEGADRSVTRIEYKLGQHCDRWRVHDVLVDGVSLVETYRAQFDKLFRRGTFDDLLAIMRRKLRRTAGP